MTLPRLYALQKHWRSFPPVHITAALFAGVKPAETEAAELKPVENVWELVREIDDNALAMLNTHSVARAPQVPHG